MAEASCAASQLFKTTPLSAALALCAVAHPRRGQQPLSHTVSYDLLSLIAEMLPKRAARKVLADLRPLTCASLNSAGAASRVPASFPVDSVPYSDFYSDFEDKWGPRDF